jgi:prophage regulatory protein
MIKEKFDPSIKPTWLTRDTVAKPLNPPINKSTFLRIGKVVEASSISRAYIYQLSKAGKFPKPVSLVPGGTSVAWVASEVQDWIDARIAERDGGAANE